jgi:osmoprotectant transport system ATP-binding protein
MLELRGVSKGYEGATALATTDLVIERARTTVLIGPSGCGKSTLLRLMIGLITPDTGSVILDGVTLTDENSLALRHRVGFMIQDGGLFPHLTARDNVALMARYLRWDEEKIAARSRELAALVRLPDGALDRFPTQLSGGQRQRVSLMRALMLDPALLLLDEPLGAIDPMIRAELQTEVKQIFRTLGKTVVLVTHDIAEAAYLGDEIILLRAGKIVQRGTLADLERAPADPFVTAFLHAQHPLPSLPSP